MAGIWWNLNLQLSYWPVYASNRLALGESLLALLFDHADHLAGNVSPAWRADSAAVGRTSSYDARSPVDELDANAPLGSGHPHELGNLVWALHDAWLHWRHTMDAALLRDRLYPLLRRAVGHYLHLLARGPDGKLHLPLAISPEYPKPAADTNYDLSLLRWGLGALLAASDRLGLDDAREPLRPRWRDALARLAPYPEGDDGFWIGAGVPLAESHRHFSHLLMIYPLALLDPVADRARIERSVARWIGMPGGLQGYSFVGASAMASMLGRGDDAVAHLHELVRRYVRRNTMYVEAGPVIETPLAAAQAIHELVLQSWGGVVRVFPAVPSAWADVAFADLRAQGAFLVSAVRAGGRTRVVRVRSLAGEPLRIALPMQDPRTTSDPARPLARAADGTFAVDLARGDSVTFVEAGEPGAASVVPRPVPRPDEAAFVPFGVSRRGPAAGVALATAREPPAAVAPTQLDGDGFVRDWLVLAPLPTAHGENGWEEIAWDALAGEAALAPAPGDAVAPARAPAITVRWRVHHAEAAALDFAPLATGKTDDVLGYAVTWLRSPVDRDAELRVGSSDQARVFVDGREVLVACRARGYLVDEDRVRLRLRRGWNRVVTKVVNEHGRWLLSLRLVDAAGAPLTDVAVSAAPPAAR